MIPEYLAPIANHLWQSTLFAAAAGLLTLALRNNRAAVRYALWLAASAKFLIPFSLFVALGSQFEWHPAAAITPVAWPIAIDEVIAPPVFQAAAAAPAMVSTASPIPAVILAVWAVGFAAVLFSWWRAWRPIRAALRRATPLHLDTLGLAAPLDVMSSPDLMEPAVVGVRRPVLLLPDGIADRLLPSELRAILVHEMCHIRRRDNLAAMMHMLVEALFWFHPLVWWLEARLVDERERACDEEVLRSGNDPAVYAESILKICRLYVLSSLACASGVSGANLRKRVEEILVNRVAARMNAAKIALLATTAAAAVALPLVTGLLGAPRAAAQSQTSTGGALSPEEWKQKLAELKKPRTAVPFDPKQFDKYVGFYQPEPDASFGPYIFFEFTRQGAHFFVRNREHFSDEIFAESATTFFSSVAGKPANTLSDLFTFVTDAQGNVTGFTSPGITGNEFRARRVDESVVRAAETALAERVKEQKPSPGTEAALRRYIASLQSGQPNYAELTPSMATIARLFLEGPSPKRFKQCVLKSLTFVGVDEEGRDKYEAVFEHHTLPQPRILRVVPLTPDGKYGGQGQVCEADSRSPDAQTEKTAAASDAPAQRRAAQEAPRTTPTQAVCNDPPTSRYVMKGAEVYDTQTHLTWQRCSVGQQWKEGAGCTGEVQQLNWDHAVQASSMDWRIPTRDQLSTLVSPTCSKHINEEAFPGMGPIKLGYWTTTRTSPVNAADWWDILYDGGFIRASFPGTTFAVRLVRREQSAAAAPTPDETAQNAPEQDTSRATPTRAVCNDPPTSRYVIKAGEVYDTQTKLTWARCSLGQWWQEGTGCVGEIEQMNWSTAQQQEAGPWRLPTRDEMATLVSPTCKNPAINEDAFPDVKLDKRWYWTSTGRKVFRYVDFSDGKTYDGNLTTEALSVRLVRGGQSAAAAPTPDETAQRSAEQDTARTTPSPEIQTAQAQPSTGGALPPEEFQQNTAELLKPRTAIPLDPKQFDKYVGFYQPEPDSSIAPYTFFEITRRGVHFFEGYGVHLAGQGTNIEEEIFPESPTKFFSVADKSTNRLSNLFTFVTDAQGNATGFISPGITGNEWHARKVDKSVVRAAETALAERIKEQKPSPGTEAALRRYIAGFQSGQPNYAEMTPVVATFARAFLEGRNANRFKESCVLKSLTFVGVDEEGGDKYEALFEYDRGLDHPKPRILYVGPLTPDGKYAGQAQVCSPTQSKSQPQDQVQLQRHEGW